MGTRAVYWCAVVCVLGVAGAAMGELVGHWKLDEGSGTTVTDSSGYGNHGTIVGNPTWIPGVSGKALEFHGLGAPGGGGDYINCGNDASMNITGPISIALWIRPGAEDPEGQGTETAPMAKADSGMSPSWSYQIRYGWGSPQPYMAFTFNTSPRAWVYVGQNLVRDEWAHIACTHDGATLRCYLNGEETDSTAMGAITASNTPVLIGSDGWGCDWIGGIDDVRLYSRGLTQKELIEAMLGGGPELATNPIPANEAADVPRDATLSWTAGAFAVAHDVYIGATFDDVNEAGRTNPMGVLLSEGQAATTYDPPDPLDFATTYYWRIDEVNGAPDNTIFKGTIWHFTTEPFAYAIENIIATSNGTSEEASGPERTVDGSGINENDEASTDSKDMWLAKAPDDEALYIHYEFDRVCKLHEMLVWNYNVQFEMVLGLGLKDVTIEYSEDGIDWVVLGDVEFARATARAGYRANTTVDFEGIAAKYVRLTVNSNWGGTPQFGLSEVRFTHIPVRARDPQPADGAADVDPDTLLNWRAGRDATLNEVYLGDHPDELPLVGSTAQTTFTPDALHFGSTYHWRVDAIGDDVWTGDLWSFTTQEYAVIDDFESYTDDIDAGEAIFDTWLDGWVNETGSTVGHLETPFAERTIVYSGRQSMPLEYNNADSPWYSEATRTWGTPQDWMRNGADTLVLHVRGNPPVLRQRADGSILMGSTGGDIWDNADAFRMAYKRLSGNGSIIARVDSIVNTAAWAKGGVMIRETLDPGSKHAMVVVTPGNGVALQHRPTTNQASLSVNQTGLTAPYWVKLTRTNNTLTAERSEDGNTWVPITADAAASTVTISMANDVYIGLALVSNNAGAGPTAAEFSNIETTGNVTGQWQPEDIGGGQLPSNDPEPLYVAIADSTGQVAVVTHEDPEATLTATWEPWQISFSALSGVNLSRVREMTIGLGNRANPTPGGTGLLYIDDVAFGRPLAGH